MSPLDIFLIGALFAAGLAVTGFLVYWLVLLVMWPFRLKEELRNEKMWHENTKEYLETARKENQR
jgi:hypothetical protein